MNATTQTPEADAISDETSIALRILEVEAAISEGTGDVVALMREGRELRDQQAALRVIREQEQQREYTARLQEQQRAIAEAYGPDLQELLELLPRVAMLCAGLRVTQEKYPEWWGAHAGAMPYQFPRDLSQLIQAGCGLELDFGGSNHVPKRESGVQFVDRRPTRRVENNATFEEWT